MLSQKYLSRNRILSGMQMKALDMPVIYLGEVIYLQLRRQLWSSIRQFWRTGQSAINLKNERNYFHCCLEQLQFWQAIFLLHCRVIFSRMICWAVFLWHCACYISCGTSICLISRTVSWSDVSTRLHWRSVFFLCSILITMRSGILAVYCRKYSKKL